MSRKPGAGQCAALETLIAFIAQCYNYTRAVSALRGQKRGKGANMMTRRSLIAGGVAGAAAAFSSAWRTAAAGVAATFEVTHSDAEWRKMLKPDQYQVL